MCGDVTQFKPLLSPACRVPPEKSVRRLPEETEKEEEKEVS